MNAIQQISLELLRERGGTPFEPAGPDHPHDQAPTKRQRETGRNTPRTTLRAPSMDGLARLAG
jgi:hypothetical protein